MKIHALERWQMLTNPRSPTNLPVLAWWPRLLEALGPRYTHDPTRSGQGFENLHDPLKNPEGNVAGWGLTDRGTGRLFLISGDADYLNIMAAYGVVVVRSPAEGVYVVEELTTSGRRPHQTCKTPAEIIEVVDKYTLASRLGGAPSFAAGGSVQAGNVISLDSRRRS